MNTGISTRSISRKCRGAIGHLGERESVDPHHTKKMLEVPYTQMLRFFFASLHEQAARTSGGQAKHARDALSAW